MQSREGTFSKRQVKMDPCCAQEATFGRRYRALWVLGTLCLFILDIHLFSKPDILLGAWATSVNKRKILAFEDAINTF